MDERSLLAGVSAFALLMYIPAMAADNPAEAAALVTAFAQGDARHFAADEQVRLFLVGEVQTRNVFRLGGLQLESRRIDHVLAFLPHGVLAASDAGRSTVARWRPVAGGFEVTLPGGRTAAIRLGRGPNGQVNVTGFGLTYWEVPRPSDASLAGRYETMNGTSAGGGALATMASTGHQVLVLAPNHRFEISATGSTIASDERFVAGASRSGVLRGRWRYQPGSFALTLEPEGGRPVLAGPTFPSSTGPQQHDSPTTDWTILGRDNWWRINQAAVPSR